MHHPDRVLFVTCVALLGTASSAFAKDWETKVVADGKKNSCVVVSAPRPINDGYQPVTAQIVVDSKSVSVKSDSVFDMGSSDIGFRVGKRDLIAADKVLKDKQAVFDSNYDTLVKLFKAGKEVTLQARFWPTWPTTGTHNTSFSLIGFTKAYEEAMKCE